jgi:hypothetical protein
MATSTTPSAEAILGALTTHPHATVTELARAAGIGKSTAGKLLATLEAQGRAVRRPGERTGGRRAPDQWSRAAEPAEDAPTASATTAHMPMLPTPAESTASEQRAQPAASTDPTDAVTSARLRPGALRGLVLDHLTQQPGQELTPTAVAKALGRSAGAVGNALATLAATGEVVQASGTPRRYAIARNKEAASTAQPA